MKIIKVPRIYHYLLILVVTCLILQTIYLIPGQYGEWISSNAAADSVSNTLSNGNSEITLTFNPSGGSDSTARLNLPKGCEVLSASFNVSGHADSQSSYPRYPKIDVGDDGDLEWEFNISGAGALGKQDEFVGSIPYKLLVLNKGESDTSMIIRLPRSATVTSASLNVHGYNHGVPNGDFESGTMTGWTTVTNQYSDTIAVQTPRGGNNPPGGWGNNYYLMLRSNPFGSHDDNCNIDVVSDSFPRLDTNYITMDWDLVENDDFSLYIRIEDDNGNYVTARSFGGDNNVDHSEALERQVIGITSLTGKNLDLRLRMWDGSWDWPWQRNDWGRLSVDNIYISDGTGNPLPTYPTDVSVDIGSDGSKELSVASLTGISPVPGLIDTLNTLLNNPSPACQVTVDKYGNEFLDIPINVSIISSAGMVNITDLEIEYDYKAQVNINPRGTLTDELNSLIPSSGTGNVTIPIAIESLTGGKIKISEIYIHYNAVPIAQTIPIIEIYEDTLNPNKLDLFDYFQDDSIRNELKFEIAEHSSPDKVEAIIEGEHYLTLNANQAPDWNGNITLVIRATDRRGLSTESNPFKVVVLPMNDEPRVKVPISKLTLWEDSAGITVSLNDIPYFIDIEGEPLYYSAVVDPQGIYPEAISNLFVSVVSNNILRIVPAADWYGYNVPVRLYCDDDNEPINTGTSSPHQQFYVDVLPINDAPILEPFDTLYLDEDESIDNWLKLSEVASDVETMSNNLKFSVVSNDNEENIGVSVDNDNYLDITILTLDYVGTAKVKIQVMDGHGAVTEESFKIVINPLNDGPRIMNPIDNIEILEDTIDSTSMNLFDVFYDPDSPITFTFTDNHYISIDISPENGTVTFKPGNDWFGTEFIKFTALDTFVESGHPQLTTDLVINVTVLPVNDPPTTPNILSPQEPRANPRRHVVEFKSAEAIDVDSSEFQYYWDFDNRKDSDGDGDPTNDPDGIGRELEHEYTSSGYYYVTLIVSDGELNCSPAAGVYVKITTNFGKVSKELAQKGSTLQTDVMLTLPFIIIIILLILGIFFIRRKDKRESVTDELETPERLDKLPPPVLDGEIVSESRAPGTALPPVPAIRSLPPIAKPVEAKRENTTMGTPQHQAPAPQTVLTPPRTQPDSTSNQAQATAQPRTQT